MSLSPVRLQTEPLEDEVAIPAWKAELNAKLEAHRQRRGAVRVEARSFTAEPLGADARRESGGGRETSASRTTAAKVAARVAERYAQAPTYSEVLAARAAAAAAAAAMAAAAVEQAEEAARELLSSLAGRGQDDGDEQGGLTHAQHACGAENVEQTANAGMKEELDSAAGASSLPGRGPAPRIEHPEPLPERSIAPARMQTTQGTRGLVDAFAEAEVPAAMSLPAKLIEFPRELVAAQRARPRYAEGPLMEEAATPALRIFEVEGELTPELRDEVVEAQELVGGVRQIGGASPSAAYGSSYSRAGGEMRRRTEERRTEELASAPGWQSIRLGEHPVGSRDEDAALRHRRPAAGEAPSPSALHVAAAGDRAMAAVVDAVVVIAGFLLFVLVFASCTAHPPVNRVALGCGAVVLGALAVFYLWLFLSYGGGTLGMRYARIALCTFDGENPTRQMLRSRVWVSVMAALPLGLGLVWAVFDEDSLGWHDRMTRTYQRSYR